MSDASNRAFAEWCSNTDPSVLAQSPHDIAIQAFEAGWKARQGEGQDVITGDVHPAMYDENWPHKPPTTKEAFDIVRDAKTRELLKEMDIKKEPWS